MSELPDGVEPAPIPEPKDAALGILVRRHGGAIEALFGRRSRRSRFMPGNLVFPGGRLEPGDEPDRAGAFERCASREILEETGVAVPVDAWRAAGERTTPPIFPVRFRTRFFVAELPTSAGLPAAPPSPDEIEALTIEPAHKVLTDWEAGRALVPPPVLPILRLLAARERCDPAAIAAQIAARNAEEDALPRIEFLPGVWVLPVVSRTLPPASCTNVWMPGGPRFVVVDPGSEDSREIERLLAVIARRAASGDAAHAVVLTHHHRDHVGGAAAVASALGVPLLAHAETISRLPEIPRSVPVRALADGDVLDLDGTSLTVLHTPGHAPGHIALFDGKLRALYAGDLVSGLSTILVGFSDGDMDAYLASLRRAVECDPKTVLPAHGPPLPGIALSNVIAHREAREAGIVASLNGGALPLRAIAEAAYADTPETPAFLREMQTRAHLDRLLRRGAVGKRGDSYFIPGI